MSHITDLIKSNQFQAALAPASGLKLLRRRLFFGAAAILIAGKLGLTAYHAVADVAVSPPAAPTPVTVASVLPRHMRLWTEFSGRLAAVDSAEIRPQVNGRITEIRFKDGQQVHEGDILFVIDPRPYEAAVAKAEADLATSRTNANLARVELDRARRLIDQQAIAHDYFDQKNNASGVAQAAIQSAAAALTQAKLDVDHAYVKAPISGRVSRAEITVGNLVQTSPAPLLTTIVSDNGIYADFDVDEQTYLQSVRAHATTADQEHKIPVELSVQGDNGHVYKGTIESFDNKIDTGTGTIRARARFANEDGALVPGMFASVKLASAANSTVMLVPDDAIGSDQSKRFVFVVGQDRKAAFREVTLGQDVNGERVVLSGLQPREKIIVDGVQRVQPGAVVEPHLAGPKLASN